MFAMESLAYFARTFTAFNFKFSLLFSKIDTPESFIVLYFFTTKVSMLISVEGVQALSRPLNDKIPSI